MSTDSRPRRPVDLRMAFGGLKIFDKLNFSMRRGERHAVIGPNGAGKSTFVNLVTGLLKPTGGELLLEGRDVTGARRRSSGCRPDWSERSRSTRSSRRSILSNRWCWRCASVMALRGRRGARSAA